MNYEIDENNAALIYVPSQDAPLVYQDVDPASGKPFKSAEAAAKWAEAFIASWTPDLGNADPIPES